MQQNKLAVLSRHNCLIENINEYVHHQKRTYEEQMQKYTESSRDVCAIWEQFLGGHFQERLV